jgi:hypothetical protein
MKTLRISLLVSTLALVAATSAYAAGLTAVIASPIANSTVTTGQTVTLQGSVTNAAAGGVNYLWSFNDGTASIGGQNQTVAFNATGTKVITLAVNDSSFAQDAKTVSINVIAGTSTPATLAISNVQATNVTTSGVTITWTTNLPATSRVIFDTTSHAGTIDLAATTTPNYGYANSTTLDSALVTSHSVVVSGLAASTKYYFRVISTN